MIDRRLFLGALLAGVAMANRPLLAIAGSTPKPDPLLEYDAIGLAKLVKSKQVSARELVEACIARIEALDGKINGVVTRTFERALAAAEKVDLDAPLAGVPFLLKDNIEFEGVKTTQGTAVFKNHIAKASAPLVKKYEAAGLIILGKTNMPELGLIPSTESKLLGPCRNPWSLAHSAGGSSGGSAAAVAAGYLPVAHATDGGGSIRVPASCCGLFGLKPSRRRMLWGASDQTEFMADHCVSRSVRDSALLFALTQNNSPDSPYKPVELVSGPSKRRLKIGLCIIDYYGKMPHKDVKNVVEATAKLCEGLGHTVVELKNPINGNEFYDNFSAIFSGRMLKLADQVKEMTGKPAEESGLLERFTTDFIAECRSLGSDAIENGHQYLKKFGAMIAQWMEPVDLVLTPVLSTPPPKLGYLFDPTQDYKEMAPRVFGYAPYTPVQNALGQPAMSVPLGMSSDGLPIGSHFVAQAGDERTLFELAYELEQAKPWANKWAPNSAKKLND